MAASGSIRDGRRDTLAALAMNGELRIVEDVPTSFAALVAQELGTLPRTPARLGASGGGSGIACHRALAARSDIAFEQIALYFVDERCVALDSRERNANAITTSLGARFGELAGFYPMSYEEGPEAYEQLLTRTGPLDIVQLGMGPDGHTASLFPDSAALTTAPGRLVVTNRDPHQNNPHDRLTLTYEAIASAALVIFAVIGADKASALARIAGGEDLPAGRVDAARLIWLVDQAAASSLTPSAPS